MKIDKKIIKELSDYLNEFNLTELEYTEKDTKIKVSKNNISINNQTASTNTNISPKKDTKSMTNLKQTVVSEANEAAIAAAVQAAGDTPVSPAIATTTTITPSKKNKSKPKSRRKLGGIRSATEKPEVIPWQVLSQLNSNNDWILVFLRTCQSLLVLICHA